MPFIFLLCSFSNNQELLLKLPPTKTSLKAQIDDLAANNSVLKEKADGLADEVAQLRTDSAKAQELANKHRMEAESKEKGLHQCLQTALDSLHSKPCSPYSI
jgi:vacuolar-type H+-ATPase subunit D/Vma8